MNKSILISIQSKHLSNILNGDKTLELRKTVPKDFKGWVYIYCTKGKPYYEPRIDAITNQKVWNIHNDFIYHTDLNGKIVARFWFDDYYTYNHNNHRVNLCADVAGYNVMYDDLDKLCLNYREVEKYGKEKELYAWHINNLEIFDEPMLLSEFKVYDNTYDNVGAFGWMFDEDEKYYSIKRPPQSYQFIYRKERKNENRDKTKHIV